MSILASIGTALPPYRHQQSDILQFMLEVYQADDTERRKLEILYKKTGIDTRYSAIADYGQPAKERQFYAQTPDLEPFPKVEQRLQVYQDTALGLALKAVKQAQQNIEKPLTPTHIITVSCTGFAAPGLDIALLKALELPYHTQRTSVNFMGCYAGFHALKQADLICQADDEAVVLVVCIELCTLHFQKTKDIDNLTANAIFADGATATLVISENAQQKNNLKGLKLETFYSEIMPQGESDMAWEISSTGFLMTLSSYIPQLIQQGITPLIEHALVATNTPTEEIDFWAIHPGGKRILEVIEKVFALPKDKIKASWETLRNFGNMSSVTVFFVWKYLWDNQIDWQKQEKILSMGFGPGLTIETALLKVVR